MLGFFFLLLLLFFILAQFDETKALVTGLNQANIMEALDRLKAPSQHLLWQYLRVCRGSSVAAALLGCSLGWREDTKQESEYSLPLCKCYPMQGKLTVRCLKCFLYLVVLMIPFPLFFSPALLPKQISNSPRGTTLLLVLPPSPL